MRRHVAGSSSLDPSRARDAGGVDEHQRLARCRSRTSANAAATAAVVGRRRTRRRRSPPRRSIPSTGARRRAARRAPPRRSRRRRPTTTAGRPPRLRRHRRLGDQCRTFGVVGSASHSVHEPSYTATSPSRRARYASAAPVAGDPATAIGDHLASRGRCPAASIRLGRLSGDIHCSPSARKPRPVSRTAPGMWPLAASYALSIRASTRTPCRRPRRRRARLPSTYRSGRNRGVKRGAWRAGGRRSTMARPSVRHA